MNKDFFRVEVKKLRNSMKEIERKNESRLVCEKILELSEYKRAKKILSFMNFGSEIEIEILNNMIIESQRELFLPRIEKDGELSIVKFDFKFKRGQFGIREPIGEEYLGALDLIIVPGLAFDREGNRIGYGKGYYDRLFSKYLNVKKIAPIFEFQLFSEIPTEIHDVKIDIIITKNEVLKLKRS